MTETKPVNSELDAHPHKGDYQGCALNDMKQRIILKKARSITGTGIAILGATVSVIW